MDNWDKFIQKKIKKLIKHNDTIVDVGVNFGVYLDFFNTLISEEGRIFCYDLNEICISSLKSNYKQEHISIEQIAISDSDGSSFYYDGGRFGYHGTNIVGVNAANDVTTKLGSIETKRLDTIFKETEKINLIKIDVEGAELKVLDGMVTIFDKIDYILLECHHDNDWEKILKIINKNNFVIFDLENNNIKTENPANRIYQILLINQKKLEDFKKANIS